jgi:hypothetical protein
LQLILTEFLRINYNVVISNIKFECDPKKASANEKKQGITFDEARTVFFDENAKLIEYCEIPTEPIATNAPLVRLWPELLF